MIITFNEEDHEILVNDNSYRYRAIMADNNLTLYFDLPEYFDIPVGAYCFFQGEKYTLMLPQNFKKNGIRKFEYTLVMESDQALLGKYKCIDPSSKRLKFSMTATPRAHMQLIVDNLNMRGSGWTVGNCLEATEKVISYNHNFCNEAVIMTAEAFGTEFEIIGKSIHLGKVEYNKTNPLRLSYGKGNGFLPGVGRTNIDNSKPIEILFVQGGERNIDKSTYGSKELLLPAGQSLNYLGRTYVVDAAGTSIRRSDKTLVTNEEFSIDLSNIYPSRIGQVSSTMAVDIGANKYDFVDASIPENLDFNECLIVGETMTVIFQDGMLAGRQFDVKYIHETRRFELVKQDLDGETMPNQIFMATPGNTYIVYGISLPSAYVRDDDTKTGASWDMFREAVKYLNENEDSRFSFSGELDGIWSKIHWDDSLQVGTKIKIGGFVSFSDLQFQITEVPIRITGIKDPINNPHSPVIELSNMSTSRSVASDLRKIAENEVATITQGKDMAEFVRRKHNSIISIDDGMLKADEIVRSESLDPRMLSYDAGTPQFSIKDAMVETGIAGDPNVIRIGSGQFINHQFNALGREGIQALKDANQAYDPTREWTIPETTLTLPNDGGHFIYIKVPLS